MHEMDEIIKNKSETKKSKIYTIQSIIILFPWARKLLQECDFLELDGSYKALRPYCFSLTNCIHHNESYPIGLSISPTENEDIYERLVTSGELFGIPREEWKTKFLLSDMGTSLCSFGREYCKFHFFCQKHIMEHFGPHSSLFIFVSKLLRMTSFDEYDGKRFLMLEQLKRLKKKRDDKNLCNEQFDIKYKELLVMLSGDTVPDKNKWHYSHWALWVRANYGVSTCSNHNEGFHSGAKMKAHRVAFSTEVSHLVKKVMRHITYVKNNHGYSLKNKLHNRLNYVISKMNDSNVSFTFSQKKTANVKNLFIFHHSMELIYLASIKYFCHAYQY